MIVPLVHGMVQMSTPNDRSYAETHEWHLQDEDVVTIGITSFAASELTDITYAEMKEVGTEIDAGESIGEIESVKATSEIYSAVGGVIIDVNDALADDPGLINRDSYEQGWLCKIKVTDPSGMANLMDAAAYDARYPQ